MEVFTEQSDLMEILSDVESGDNLVKSIVVQVVAIDRYLIDASNQNLAIDETVNYLYDVIITDGKSKIKTLLSSDLDHLVQKNHLKRSSVCLVALKEEFFNEKPIIVIKRLRLLSPSSKPIGDIKYCLGSERCDDPHTSLESFIFPLTGARHYFVNTWNDTIIEWPLPCPEGEPLYISPNNFSERTAMLLKKAKHINLQALERLIGKSRYFIPLVVRVISAGKLTQLSKIGDSTHGNFRGIYVVTDGSAVTYMSIWDSVIASLYSKIQLNSVLLIQNYHAEKFKRRANLKFANVHKVGTKLPLTSYEIKVNAKKETSIAKTGHGLYIFQPGDERLLPDLPFAGFIFFTSFNNVDPKGRLIYDIAGIVVSLSRYERLPRYELVDKKMQGVWVVRWIEIVHWPNQPPLKLQVFVNGQIETHYELRVGNRVVISNMRLDLANESNKNYFTSTNETQLVILTQQNLYQFGIFRELLNLYEMSDDVIKQYVEKGNGVGGMYPLFIMPKKKTDLNEPFEEKIKSNLMWSLIIDNMWFWLSKRITIRGEIAEVTFMNINIQEMRNFKSLNIYKNETVPLKSMRVYGLQKPHRNTFAQKYNENMTRPYQFPVTSFLTDISNYKEEIILNDDEPINFVCDGYYEVIIVDGENAIKCFFFPQPTQRPFPSLKQTLNLQFTPLEPETQDRINYTEEEVMTCAHTVDKFVAKGTFIIELFKHSDDECEAILRQMCLPTEEAVVVDAETENANG